MTADKPSSEEAEDRRQPDRVLDTRALRALAHPLRVQLYDIISQYGPQTASSLATMTGESSGSTSYHLRELAKHDLIHEVEGRGSGRERWWARPRGGVSFGDPEVWGTPAGRAASEVVMSEYLTRRHQQLMRFVSEGMTETGPWGEAAMISTANGRLTVEQLSELSRAVQALVTAAVEKARDQPLEDSRPVTIRVDMFPLPEEGI